MPESFIIQEGLEGGNAVEKDRGEDSDERGSHGWDEDSGRH